VARGLVDELGGLPRAVEKARELARIQGDAELVLWPPDRAWYEELFRGADDEDGGGLGAGALGVLAQNLWSGRPLALSPFAVIWER